MTVPHDDILRRTVRDVRRRYLARVALRGAAIVLVATLGAFLVSAYGLEHFRYSPWAIAIFRIFAYTAALGLFVRFLVLPLLARPSDERIAMYVEEHEPSLDAAFVSAVEAEPRARDGRAGLSPELVERLVEIAVERVQRIEYGRLVERPRLQRFSALLAGAAALGMLGALLSPAFVRQAAPYLLAPWSVRAASPYAIEVEPGNVTIARGSDQVVVARLKGFDADKVELSQKGPDGDWKRGEMLAGEAAADRRSMLLGVQQPVEYFVESNGVRSPVFKLDVVDKPYVKRIDLEYVFPAYTGLQPQKVENSGDVAALKGTEVRVKITPTFKVPSGTLRLDDDAPLALAAEADGTLRGAFTIARDGFYKVALPGRGGVLEAASPDYAVTMLKDQPPSISFVKPGRDTKVTPIEEVFAEVKAEDDYGVSRVELVYSVNGGPEKSVPLLKGGARKFVSAGHTFFLEEMDLKTGDFVSYFARASDVGAPAQTATTDIYFLEARPFRRDYRQAEQKGGGAQGGQQQDGSLSMQQRQVIAATFKLVRDRVKIADKEFGENLATVGLVQSRLREQVDSLVNRMSTRGILEPGSDFQTTAAELRLAVAEMKNAEASIGKKLAKDALPPEQKALAHLQRAEGAFRDVQVSFEQNGGGGGGGSSAEELADLFELELDKLRNQYETVERGQQEKADEKVDEALQRLQELARRQEQENERQKQRASKMAQGGGGGSSSQQQLAEEAEEEARKLERLTREKPSPALDETVRRLKEAADSMRRSAANSKSGQTADGQAALDKLKDARRLLDQNRTARLGRDLREARQKADELRQAQERIAADMSELGTSGPTADKTQRLMERKDALASQVSDLESKLDQMARDSRREQKDASRKLQEAASGIRDSKLKEKIRYTKGFARGGQADTAQQFEKDISESIGAIDKRLGEAAGAMGQPEEQKRAAALDKARNLVRNMESLQERLSGEPGKPGGANSEKEPGQQQGQQGKEGQQGKQPGQQGKEGQPGKDGQGKDGHGKDGQQGKEGQQGSGGQQQGPNGEGRAQGQPGNAMTGGRPQLLSSEDARQLRRELRERAGEAQDLQRELQRGGIPGQEAEAVARRLRALDSEKNFGDPRGLAQLTAQVVDDLKLLEYSLRRTLEGEKPKLYLSGSEELPPGYKALVEEYYKSLARKP